jgi:antiviral helicase SLH1
MQLTKAEIAETQVIVTTPEKWDVVTRKPTGEGEIASVRSSQNASCKPMTIGHRHSNFSLLMRCIS